MVSRNDNELVIGIPRGMSYYGNYPFWYGFFTALGFKIVLSDPTTKQTMSDGSALVVTETCLPIKIYLGHILNLINKKGVKNIFVPSLQSIAPKIYNCSKIRGLPDLVRNVVKGDYNLVEATLDKSVKKQGLYEFLYEAVSPFGIMDFDKIKSASKQGWKVYNNFLMMMRAGVSYKKALSNALQGKILIESSEDTPINIALISHGYNIYDERACMKIFDKLENMDVKVFTSLQLTNEQMEEGVASFSQKKYWANELEMTGAAGHYLKDTNIDGIITLNAFGCGPDSLMIERIMRKAKELDKPMLSLTIDEHTGEAGFITRLEAFIDMLYRKKRIASNNKNSENSYNYVPQTNICENLLLN